MTGHPWLPPTGETITIVIAFLVAVLVIVLLAPASATSSIRTWRSWRACGDWRDERS
jgi:hypothetical protein